ncbi:MAG: HAMP domain-containing protein, partial [Rhodospirillaceae bacterium]
MTIRRVSFLTAMILACLFLSVTALKIKQLYEDQGAVRQMALAAEAASKLNEAIIELSLERSVMQVTLNLPTPIAPQFRDLIDGQRRLSDTGFQAVAETLAGADEMSRSQDFLARMQQLRLDIEQIRTRADLLLAVEQAERNASEIETLPTQMKALIEGFAQLPGMIRAETVQIPSLVQTLEVIQTRAWEVREYGGQERTYMAIATATGAPISSERKAEMDILHKRASYGLDALAVYGGYAGLPTQITADIQDVLQFYQGDYGTIREGILEASRNQTAYPIDFGGFFTLSSDALGRAVQLSKDAGTEIRVELEAITQAANLELMAYWALLIVAMLICGFQVYYTRYSVARRMDGIVHLLSRLSGGDTSVDSSPYKSGDEIGKLADSVDVFRDWIQQKNELEAVAAQEQERSEQMRSKAIRDMADLVENKTETSVGDVNQSTADIEKIVQEMRQAAGLVGGNAADVNSASEQAFANSEAVSAAAQQLSQSISDISNRIASASTVARNSMELADEVQGVVVSLNEAADNVSNVVTLISEIADQTNLLA